MVEEFQKALARLHNFKSSPSGGCYALHLQIHKAAAAESWSVSTGACSCASIIHHVHAWFYSYLQKKKKQQHAWRDLQLGASFDKEFILENDAHALTTTMTIFYDLEMWTYSESMSDLRWKLNLNICNCGISRELCWADLVGSDVLSVQEGGELMSCHCLTITPTQHG